jgi:methionyl aminopeptidase
MKHEKVIEASGIAAKTLQELAVLVKPGVTDTWLADRAGELMRSMGAEPACLGYRGFPANICVSINNVFAHGIPKGIVIKEGDLVSLDVVARKDGFHGDCAATVPVHPVGNMDLQLVKAVYRCLKSALATITEGSGTEDITRALHKTAGKAGVRLFPQFCGHGIGEAMHEAPPIFNAPAPGNAYVRLSHDGPFSCVCVEPMGTFGAADVIVDADGWSAGVRDGSKAAHFEDTVVLGEHGVVVPTAWPHDLFREVFGFWGHEVLGGRKEAT